MERTAPARPGEDTGSAQTGPQPLVEAEPDSRLEAVDKAAVGAEAVKGMTPEEYGDALSWLIGDDDTDDGVVTQALTINVGTDSNPRNIPWTIKNVDREVLRAIQKETRGNRAQRRSGAVPDVDAEQVSLRVVSQGTVEPDLDKAAEAKGIPRAPDPDYHRMTILKHRFRNKPGLIDQLSTWIFDLSGFSDEAIQEAKEVSAAGN